MTNQQPSLVSLHHPIYQGLAGAIAGAMIGLFVGNSGAVSTVLPGAPTVTTTVTAPPATITVSGPTVTATVLATASTDPTTTANIVHLADPASRPEGLLVENSATDVNNVGINGKVFSVGWDRSLLFESGAVTIVGINVNRAYSHLKARLGVSSTSGARSARMLVTGDGKALFDNTVSLTKSYDVDLAVSDFVRVLIQVYPPQGGPDIKIAVGDPLLEQ